VDRSQLRQWIEDALARHDRDARERGEAVANVTVDEIVDAVWGRLPLEVRREASRAQVQASLTVLTLQRGIARARDNDGAQGPGPDGSGARQLGPDDSGARQLGPDDSAARQLGPAIPSREQTG
jgi:hypothetical protein